MAVTSICGGCRKSVDFPIQDLGRATSCPHCGTEIIVGVASGAAPGSSAQGNAPTASPAPKAKAVAVATAVPVASAIPVAQPLSAAKPPVAAKPVATAKPAVAAAAAPLGKATGVAAAPSQPIVLQTKAATPSSRISAKRPEKNKAFLIVSGAALLGLLVIGGLGAAALFVLSPTEEEDEPLVAQADIAAPVADKVDEPLPVPGAGGRATDAKTPAAPDAGHTLDGDEDDFGEEAMPPLNETTDDGAAPVGNPFEEMPLEEGDEPEMNEPQPRTPPELPVVERPIPTPTERPIEKPITRQPIAAAETPESDDPLVGRVASMLYVVRGEQKLLENVRIAAIDAGKEESSVKSIQFRLASEPETKRARKLPIEQIVRIVVGDRRHDVRFDRKQGVYSIVDTLERREQVGANLLKQGHQLWELPTAEEQAKYVDEHRRFISEANTKMGGKLQVQENDFFIFGSDLPPIEAEQSLVYLTAMYTKLCAMFGVMPGENIWRGKCVIIVFRQESDYFAFEQQIMDNAAPQGTAGLHHGYRDGKTIITCQRGKDAAFYRSVLVHETVHGFVHRFQSSVHVPSWINEGIADWISDVVVPDSNEVDRRRVAARRELAQSRTLGDEFFRSPRITAAQYGIASDITDFMLQSDPAGYRYFLEGVKEGKPWEESLQESFGISQEQLAALYFANRVGR